VCIYTHTYLYIGAGSICEPWEQRGGVCMCVYIHAYIHSYIQIRGPFSSHGRSVVVCVYVCIHIHTYIHTYIYIYILTYTHIHTYIHTGTGAFFKPREERGGVHPECHAAGV